MRLNKDLQRYCFLSAMAPPVQHPFLILILAIDYHYSHVVDSPVSYTHLTLPTIA